MITSAIEYKAKCNVAVIYIPNVFIQTQQPNNENFIMRLRGIMAEIMCVIVTDIYQP